MATYTIKQLSEIINFSVPTTIKKLKKLHYKPVQIVQNGKRISAYNLSENDINKLKGSQNNISQSQEVSSPTNNNYFNEYMEAYKELIQLKSEQKLLTDNLQSKEGFYISEINRITNENKSLLLTIRIGILIFIISLLTVFLISFFFITR